jgi:hypothetical protein
MPLLSPSPTGTRKAAKRQTAASMRLCGNQKAKPSRGEGEGRERTGDYRGRAEPRAATADSQDLKRERGAGGWRWRHWRVPKPEGRTRPTTDSESRTTEQRSRGCCVPLDWGVGGPHTATHTKQR